MTTTTTNRNQVTDEQISKAHRILDDNFNTFYLVENSRGDVDAEGNVIEYRVSYLSEKKALTCTCKAGQEGRACWHIRAAVAHAKEYKALTQEAREYEETGRAAWLAEVEAFRQEMEDYFHEENYKRMMQAPLNNRNKGFSILR